jgi:hypothetical protein
MKANRAEIEDAMEGKLDKEDFSKSLKSMQTNISVVLKNQNEFVKDSSDLPYFASSPKGSDNSTFCLVQSFSMQLTKMFC